MAVNLGAYWAFGIPLSVFLAFPTGWGVRGLWIGMAVTTTVQVTHDLAGSTHTLGSLPFMVLEQDGAGTAYELAWPSPSLCR